MLNISIRTKTETVWLTAHRGEILNWAYTTHHRLTFCRTNVDWKMKKNRNNQLLKNLQTCQRFRLNLSRTYRRSLSRAYPGFSQRWARLSSRIRRRRTGRHLRRFRTPGCAPPGCVPPAPPPRLPSPAPGHGAGTQAAATTTTSGWCGARRTPCSEPYPRRDGFQRCQDGAGRWRSGGCHLHGNSAGSRIRTQRRRFYL